jgi:ATP-dependent DNA ligase
MSPCVTSSRTWCSSKILTDPGSSCLLRLVSIPKKTFPALVPPIMAKTVKAPFDSPEWIFEIKLDRYRAITVFYAAGNSHSGHGTVSR